MLLQWVIGLAIVVLVAAIVGLAIVLWNADDWLD
jgi:hypothetical protein